MKPATTKDFKARLQWLYPGQELSHWYLLCDPQTVSLPTYIKGRAKRTLLRNSHHGCWRQVITLGDKNLDGANTQWAFVDNPGVPITLDDCEAKR
jgi:hypothetical protein